MSGIAGIFHCGTIKPVDPARVERMLAPLAYRGPVSSDVWTAPGVGLGHCHLSLTDPDVTSQPLHSADERHAMSLDGKIYNSRELRKELIGLGAEIRTQDDAEIVLAAYRHWGTGCLTHFNGDFALAIYDKVERTLFLARDRFGAKPLFTAMLSDGSLAFASELKGIMAHPLLRREIDPHAIEDFMAWGYVPDHRCILRGVEKLPAGHFRLLRHDAQPAEPKEYWDISFAERRKGKTKDIEAELLYHLRQAVTSRMTSEVPLGAFLSDDPESASIVAMMAEASRDPVLTCSLLHGDKTSPDTQVAQLFATNHTSRRVSIDGNQAIDELVDMFDEPFAYAAALQTWQLGQLARENATIVLVSDGADEIMAGNGWQISQHRMEKVRRIMPDGLRDRIPVLFGNAAEIYARAVGAVSPEQRRVLHGDGFRRQLGDYRAEHQLGALLKGAPVRSGLDMAQYADIKFRLPGNILARLDRTSMAVGLELREPFLDHHLAEFVAALPERLRVKGGQGKYLLKKAMGRYLPDDLLSRKQQGFALPIAQWLRGSLQGRLRALSTSATLVGTGWFDRAQLSRLAEAHIAGRSDHSQLLWRLIILDRSMKRLGAGA